MVNPSFRSWARSRDVWATLPGYALRSAGRGGAQRVIAAIIVVALYRLIVAVIDTLVIQALNPLDHVVFQAVFGAIMTLPDRARVQSHPPVRAAARAHHHPGPGPA